MEEEDHNAIYNKHHATMRYLRVMGEVKKMIFSVNEVLKTEFVVREVRKNRKYESYVGLK